ncbi:hypothetical protein M440DRAFT_1237210 [Trichoderma longibrachiatum ATCC 18648]|uniref:Uncharacterized protein n=1 Tax=Trichoderma longibrachiatum ATCC 18648 TaxID=983965 RepID=A0A2T4C5S1_TRILO|nr:hypothetical protein M440DRAFT_1237210 [Trichoderma longibrachiatum ATCC 18648]
MEAPAPFSPTWALSLIGVVFIRDFLLLFFFVLIPSGILLVFILVPSMIPPPPNIKITSLSVCKRNVIPSVPAPFLASTSSRIGASAIDTRMVILQASNHRNQVLLNPGNEEKPRDLAPHRQVPYTCKPYLTCAPLAYTYPPRPHNDIPLPSTKLPLPPSQNP